MPLRNHLQLVITDGETSATLRIKPGWDRAAFTREAVLSLLDACKIVRQTIDEHALAELINEALSAPTLKCAAVIARSRPPIPGSPETFEFDPALRARFDEIENREKALRAGRRHDTPAEPEEAPPDPTDTEPASQEPQDYYNFSPFVVVEKGQHLGVIHPPTPGTDGVTVRGAPIAAAEGAKCRYQFRRGVEVTDEGDVVATLSGHLTDRTGIIDVSPTLRVDHDVDFTTGHIRFPGDVDVKGGIGDRFIVKTRGSLRVHGLVQSATIEVGKDAHLQTGMAGRGAGTLDVHGSLEVGYLEAVNAHVHRDLNVKGEVYNCALAVAGAFVSQRCTIRGGEVSVAGNAEVGTIGAPAGTETRVAYAHDPSLSKLGADLIKQFKLLADIARYAEAQHKKAKMAPLGAPGVSDDLTTSQRAFEAATECQQTTVLAAERVLDIAESSLGQRLTVHRLLHPGATVLAPGWKITVHTGVRGPVVVSADSHGKPEFRSLDGQDILSASAFANVEPDDTVPRWDELRALLEAARDTHPLTDGEQPGEAAKNAA